MSEFPFVEALPKREKSKLVKAWELLGHLREATEREGALVPVMLGAKCLDLSRTRIDSICADGRLRRVEVDGHIFITESSIVEFAKTERKNGRPLTTSSPTMRECHAMARELVQASQGKQK
jgi:hypothetical protein